MRILTILTMVACLGSVLHADNMVFDRGLPTANLNNAAGANRSNVAWGDYTPSGGENWAIGDDFNLGMAGSVGITDLRVWIVGTDSQPLSVMWSDLTLFGGGTTAASVGVLSTVSTSGSDPHVDITKVTNPTYTFFVGVTPTATNVSLYTVGVSLMLSASNKLLSGSTQEGADNLIHDIGYNGSTVATYETWDTGAPGGG